MPITFKKSAEQNAHTTRMTGRSPFRDGLKFKLVRSEQVDQVDQVTGLPMLREDGTKIQHWVIVVVFDGKTKEHNFFPTMAWGEKNVTPCAAAPNGVAENGGTFFALIKEIAEGDNVHEDKDVCDILVQKCAGKWVSIKRITWAATATDKKGNEFATTRATFNMDISE